MQQLPNDYIHDWNLDEGSRDPGRPVALNDETLRDGLQSPSLSTPSIDESLRLLHLMCDLGIDAVDIGLPGAGRPMFESSLRLAREIVEQDLPIDANAAARTLIRDIEPIAEISEAVGRPVEVASFIGSSPIRQQVESWEIDHLVRLAEKAVDWAVRRGLPVMFVTEDTTRARPEDLRRLYTAAVEAGARAVCIADTVGHATPSGARAVVRFVREVVDATGESVRVDWHGHRDRGLDLANSLAAVDAGADRIHGTALGIGERVGNTPMDLLLVNFALLGIGERRIDKLGEYCALVAEATGASLPPNYPVVGRDSFRTMTGVHAAAILKAESRGDRWLVDRVYSSVPASLVSRRQIVDVGPMSGASNAVYWLRSRGMEGTEALVDAILDVAKASPSVLEEEVILDLCRKHGVLPARLP